MFSAGLSRSPSSTPRDEFTIPSYFLTPTIVTYGVPYKECASPGLDILNPLILLPPVARQSRCVLAQYIRDARLSTIQSK